MERIDQQFMALGIRQNMVTKGDSDGQKLTKKEEIADVPNYNTRGQAVFSPSEIRAKYDNAPYFFKWAQMPFCRQTIKRKVLFWAGASGVLAWTYGEYLKKSDPKNVLKKLPKGTYPAAYIFFFGLSTIYCFAESLLFDEFCDIESPFYQDTENRLALARRIRGDMDKNKSKGIFREMF